MVGDDPVDARLRIVAMICLSAIVLAAVTGITVVAVTTDRDVRYAEGLTFAGTVLIATLGGFTLAGLRRRRRARWHIEREEENNGPS